MRTGLKGASTVPRPSARRAVVVVRKGENGASTVPWPIAVRVSVRTWTGLKTGAGVGLDGGGVGGVAARTSAGTHRAAAKQACAIGKRAWRGVLIGLSGKA